MAQGTDAPSVSDGFVGAMSERLGGPLGRYAGAALSWANPARIALATGLITFLVCLWRQVPCQVHGLSQYTFLCYTDIPLLYTGRGLATGNTPFFDTGNYPVLEYPVLTGWLMEVQRIITVLLGAPSGPGINGDQQLAASHTFFQVNAVILFALFLVTIWAQFRTVAHRPWDAMMLAASPCVAATALINWDMFPVALTALGMMFWARRRPGWAGIMLGLGMAAKLYPLLLLGPLLLLCLRSGRMKQFGTLLVTFAASWAIANLPVYLLARDQWLSFWTFNSDRGGDFGSIWYVLSLAGHPVEDLNKINFLIFALACAAIGLLILLAPQRPRFGSVAFLVLAAFLITNKVYSPQYVLWLLPFVILARPRWRDWLVFTTGEMVYFVAIWWHLGGNLAPGAGGPDKIYWLAVFIRIAAELWIVFVVVRDILQPQHDPMRTPGFDDPTGGVLDQQPDVAWVKALRAKVFPIPSSSPAPVVPDVPADQTVPKVPSQEPVA